MKIVLPVPHFPPRYSAGAELYTYRLAHRLIREGHQAEVVCVEDTASGAPGLVATSDSYKGVPVWRLAFDLRAAPDPLRWSYDNPLIREWFDTYLDERRPDLVHLQSGYLISDAPLRAAFDRRIATVVTLHDYWFACPRITLLRGDGSLCAAVPDDPAACAWCVRLASRRYRLPDKASGGLLGRAMLSLGLERGRRAMAARREHLWGTLARCDAVIALSRFLAGVFAVGVGVGRLHVLRIGLDSAGMSGPPPDEAKLRLGYIGQIAPHKGVHLLIDAMQLLSERGRPVELTIYGDLEQHPRYSATLRRRIGADRRIRLAGRFARSRLAGVLGQLDALVVPSLWYENSPATILEAQAAGRPVLASALGGMMELVRDGVDGLQFRPGDAHDLAHKIQRLREEPGLLATLRAGVVAPASFESELAQLLPIYRSAIVQAVRTPEAPVETSEAS